MFRNIYLPIKRSIDIVGAAVGIAVLSPLIVLIAVMVRMRLGSPVLFRQIRPGRNGEPFTIVKFRSMQDGDGSDAERLTPFGAKLRSTSLDELPELVNVLKGDMSLVGPRPLLTEYLPYYDGRQATRNDVRPGLTGLAQVEGRNLLEWPEKLEADARYVETMSLLGDLKVLWRTIPLILKREGTSAPGYAAGMENFETFAQRQREDS